MVEQPGFVHSTIGAGLPVLAATSGLVGIQFSSVLGKLYRNFFQEGWCEIEL